MKYRMEMFKNKIYLLIIGLLIGGEVLVFSHIKDSKAANEFEEVADENKEKYPELYFYYDNYIKLIAEEIRTCSKERDIIKDFALYNTLLYNGYISLKDYEYSFGDVEFIDLRGASTAVGEGVCVNNADNMCDVFTALGYETKIVYGKTYYGNEEKPSGVNHAVVYVSDGKNEFLLDPTNETIFLRRGYMKFCSMNSQEDKVYYFEPETHYVNPLYEQVNNYQLLLGFSNQFKNHWDILREYREYEEEAKEFMVYFSDYEYETLGTYEVEIKKVLIDAQQNTDNLK